MKLLVALAAVALVAAACGEAPLSQIGDFSDEFVVGETSTTIAGAVVTEVVDTSPGSPYRPSQDLAWPNDDLVVSGPRDPGSVLGAIWDRGRDVSSGYVQASRQDISVVLPGVGFPVAVPLDVRFVTSQLVFDTASGLLDQASSVAFGMWAEEPYSVSRTSGQLAVLRAGQSLDPNIVDDDVAAEEVRDGLSLTWQHGPYAYELFCRDTMDPDLCWDMAGSLVPLSQTFP